MTKVYLAGGFRSGWQDSLMASVTGFEWLNPKEKELSSDWDLERIGAWDFHAIRKSDIIFAYMEKDNPSGFGLAAEIGYAYGIGKTVILVLEPEHTIHKDKYLNFLMKAAHITFQDFDSGVAFLQTMR